MVSAVWDEDDWYDAEITAVASGDGVAYDVRFDDDIALDVVIGHAVRVGWQHTHPSMELNEYPKHKAHAWGQFYLASPGDCRRWQVIALRELAEQNRLV